MVLYVIVDYLEIGYLDQMVENPEEISKNISERVK